MKLNARIYIIMKTTDYVICIPSYKRAKYCSEKTLSTLKNLNINPSCIHVYVANKEDYETYKATLDDKMYNTLTVGKKGLVPQRQFIADSWPTGKHIVFFDDDVESIDLSFQKYLPI